MPASVNAGYLESGGVNLRVDISPKSSTAKTRDKDADWMYTSSEPNEQGLLALAQATSHKTFKLQT